MQLALLRPKIARLDDVVRQRKGEWALANPTVAHPVQNLLIFKPDEIGDAVQSLPALWELRKALPNAKFFLICQPKTKSIYEASGLIDEISTVDVQMRFVRFPDLKLEEALASFSISQFDAALFLRTYSSYFSYFKKLPAKALIHPEDPRMKSSSPLQIPLNMHGAKKSHQSLLMLELVSILTRKTYAQKDVTFPDLKFTQLKNAVSEPYIVLHPFAKLETKRFPENRWSELIEVLSRKFPETKFVTIGGKEDPELSLPQNCLQLQGKLSLSETGQLLQKAMAFIGNESGPGHLAACLKIPTVTLMGGHSDPHEWAPIGKSLVIRNPVFCSPCHLRVCPGLGLVCLTEMTVEKVAPRIIEFIQKSSSASDERSFNEFQEVDLRP